MSKEKIVIFLLLTAAISANQAFATTENNITVDTKNCTPFCIYNSNHTKGLLNNCKHVNETSYVCIFEKPVSLSFN